MRPEVRPPERSGSSTRGEMGSARPTLDREPKSCYVVLSRFPLQGLAREEGVVCTAHRSLRLAHLSRVAAYEVRSGGAQRASRECTSQVMFRTRTPSLREPCRLRRAARFWASERASRLAGTPLTRSGKAPLDHRWTARSRKGGNSDCPREPSADT